jgi:ABC-type glycerol-3-phosphate transport system substrate-binding protein
MTVSSDTFGEISALSMEDFLSYCRQHPDQESTPLSNDGFLTMCLKDPNLEHFLDRENGRSSFDSEEFREILTTAALFPTVDPGTVTPVSAFDKAFYRWRWMDRVDEPAYDYQRYPEGKLVYSGFPTYEESPLHIIGISPNGSALAIAEASKNKAGAWKFIEYYLNTEPGFDDMTMKYGFPSRISFLERQLDGIRNNGESDLEYNAVEGYYSGKPTLTDAQIDDFCGMIEAARPVNHANDILREIITEECGAYFAGQKSIDDVIKVIQSRVDLYLSENM